MALALVRNGRAQAAIVVFRQLMIQHKFMPNSSVPSFPAVYHLSHSYFMTPEFISMPEDEDEMASRLTSRHWTLLILALVRENQMSIVHDVFYDLILPWCKSTQSESVPWDIGLAQLLMHATRASSTALLSSFHTFIQSHLSQSHDAAYAIVIPALGWHGAIPDMQAVLSSMVSMRIFPSPALAANLLFALRRRALTFPHYLPTTDSSAKGPLNDPVISAIQSMVALSSTDSLPLSPAFFALVLRHLLHYSNQSLSSLFDTLTEGCNQNLDKITSVSSLEAITWVCWLARDRLRQHIAPPRCLPPGHVVIHQVLSEMHPVFRSSPMLADVLLVTYTSKLVELYHEYYRRHKPLLNQSHHLVMCWVPLATALKNKKLSTLAFSLILGSLTTLPGSAQSIALYLHFIRWFHFHSRFEMCLSAWFCLFFSSRARSLVMSYSGELWLPCFTTFLLLFVPS
jgi:hypothetical protein